MMKHAKKLMDFVQRLLYPLASKLSVSGFLALSLLVAHPSIDAANETVLADKPIFSGNVNGNVALALSVEWPTAVVSAYKDSYATSKTYLGYFDSEKCYSYNASKTTLTGLLFNTGVNNSNVLLASNIQDPHWTIQTTPSGVSTTKKNNLDNTASSIYSTTTAASLGQRANTVPAGKYLFKSNTFTIPSTIDPTTVEVRFTLNVNDRLSNLLINNVSTGITSTATWASGATVIIPAGSFTTATNSVSIEIENDPLLLLGTDTGFRIDNLTMTANGQYGSYFEPQANATNHACSTVTNGRWSGNYLNWALTPVIDPFRLALTGGYRSVDKIGMTILEKAYGQDFGAGNTPNKTLIDATLIANSTPFSGITTLTIRSHGLGNKFYITRNGNLYEDFIATSGLINDSIIGTTLIDTNVYEMYARNQVCKSDLLESNCTLYPDGDYKPTGLIQKNATKLRFAAFGYLMDNDVKRDAGVLRARMSSVGPMGDYPEWDASTGIFVTNPNQTDADNSGVTNSGVINYLNKFGLSAPGYKYYDPVSELYYAAGRYFRNKGNVEEYSNNLTSYMKDGFPVITTWNDPIKYSCEANFIVGVGDTNTHADANLPGSSIKSSNEPTTPSKVTSDFGSLTDTTTHYTDVKKSTNYVGTLEGLGSLGESYTPWCCSNNSFFMAGLAYDLHTRDFRPDITGKQTVTTYWLDTLEAGDRKDFSKLGMRNQFWLAAKYGGFNAPDGWNPYATTNTGPATADWDTDNNGDPDNYFRADNPSLMVSGLNAAFDSMVSIVEATTTGFALSSPNVTVNDLSFSAKYNSRYWTGSVTGNTISFNSTGNPIATEVWNTDTTLETQAAGTGWDSKRFIATSNCSDKDSSGMRSCSGIPFRYDSLNAADKVSISTVGTLTNVGNNAINFLRGDRSKEGIFRKRNKLLGDIVNSQIRAVGAPNAPYGETNNPGYKTFKDTYKARSTVAYVGANDGMLHAFKGTSGAELFAFVPNALFKGPNNTPNDDGLAALAKTTYAHHAYVDSTPVMFDVNFGNDKSPDWRSLLIGGLGKGGKSYYALDVTNPDTLTTEAKVASAVKWEFTHNDLGFSYGRPLVVKAGGKWIVILPSGYNNQDGQGYFFILEAATGKLIKKINTGESFATDAGLAHVTAFVADGRDFTADAAYAGDLHGNVWRLDLTGAATDTYPTPVKIAKLTSANNENQPITISPVVEVDQSTNKRYVFVGTGKLLNDADISNEKIQTFYAISDGTDKAFFNTSTLPSAAGGYPLNRDDMVNHTGNPNAVTEDTSKPMGYYIDLAEGYRINIPMDSSAGTIAFAANKVSGDECNVSALYRGYALSYGSGKSLLVQNNSGTATQYYQGSGVVSGVAIYKKPNATNLSVNFSSSVKADENGNTSLDTQSASASFQLLNWRTIPNND